MRMITLGLAMMAAVSPAAAEVYVGMTVQIEVGEIEVSCPTDPRQCVSCVEDTDDGSGPLGIVLIGGRSGFVPTSGVAFGTVYPSARIDDIEVPLTLLPIGTRVQVGAWGNSGPLPCGDDDAYVDVTVNSETHRFTEREAHSFHLQPQTSYGFRIEVCNGFAYLGSGCQYSGSAVYRWETWAPAQPRARRVDPGDVPAEDIVSERVVIDMSAGPGGIFTATRLPEIPDGLSGELIPVDQWDLRGDMADESFTANLTFRFEPDELPVGLDPESLRIASRDPVTGEWSLLLTVIDPTLNTATVSVDRFRLFALTTPPAVPTASIAWLELKREF